MATLNRCHNPSEVQVKTSQNPPHQNHPLLAFVSVSSSQPRLPCAVTLLPQVCLRHVPICAQISCVPTRALCSLETLRNGCHPRRRSGKAPFGSPAHAVRRLPATPALSKASDGRRRPPPGCPRTRSIPSSNPSPRCRPSLTDPAMTNRS